MQTTAAAAFVPGERLRLRLARSEIIGTLRAANEDGFLHLGPATIHGIRAGELCLVELGVHVEDAISIERLP
jgi:hypothetical protein